MGPPVGPTLCGTFNPSYFLKIYNPLLISSYIFHNAQKHGEET
jgi:hypothetical protein